VVMRKRRCGFSSDWSNLRGKKVRTRQDWEGERPKGSCNSRTLLKKGVLRTGKRPPLRGGGKTRNKTRSNSQNKLGPKKKNHSKKIGTQKVICQQGCGGWGGSRAVGFRQQL